MIAGLGAYPRMKESGVPWLGEVPEHWKVRKLRHVLRRATARNRPDLPLLSVVREKGVILRNVDSKDENHNYIPDDLSHYKVVRLGQFAMNKMKAWQGSYGVSRFEGIVSPAYFVFDLLGVAGHFFNSAIRSRAYVPLFTRASDGVRIGQWDLDETRMREIAFVVPPLPEQNAIVRFLDYADRRIRRYIRAKKKLIELLEEQKQAIIHRAVTRGLDPGVRLKASGVEWIGEIPEHWEVHQLGRFVDLLTGYPFKSEGFTQREDGVRLLRGVNISPGRIRWGEVVHWPRIDRENYSRFELIKGDIVLGMDRPIIRDGIRVTTIGEADLPALLLQRVARIRVLDDLQPMYLLLLLGGKCFSDYLSPIFTGISVPHLSPQQIKSFSFAVPRLAEQKQIIEFLTSQTSSIDSAKERALRGISLLQEYRTRLIADVVTGKLDVREAAAQLPEDDEEEESFDDLEEKLEEENPGEDIEE